MAIFKRLGLSKRDLRERPIPPRYQPLYNAPIERDSVAIWGFLQSQIGIGSSARGYARLLRRSMPDVLCHAMPLPGRDGVSFPADPPVRRAGRNIVVLNPPELLNGNQFFPSDLMRGTSIIGYWAWELPEMPKTWLPAFDLVDEVWTCSEFAARAFRRATSKKVSILPHVVEDWAHLTRPEARSRLGFGGCEDFIFLNVFDFASTVQRKNPLGVIAAFRAAFGDGPDGPLLVMKYHGGTQFPQDEARVRAAAAPCARIRMISGVLTHEDMRALFDAADGFISLHRSEGFGLNIAEAMIAGLPVICTGYSGNMDFTTPDNSLLVEWRPEELRAGDYFGWQGQTWAAPDLACASAALRYMVHNPTVARALSRQAQEDIARQFNPDVISARMMTLLQGCELQPSASSTIWTWLGALMGGSRKSCADSRPGLGGDGRRLDRMTGQ